jgi:hypothetical protein
MIWVRAKEIETKIIVLLIRITEIMTLSARRTKSLKNGMITKPVVNLLTGTSYN